MDEHIDVSANAEESQESENPQDAIDRLVERFRVPLEGAAAEASEIRGEFEAIILSYTCKCHTVHFFVHHGVSVGVVAAISCPRFF